MIHFATIINIFICFANGKEQKIEQTEYKALTLKVLIT